MEGLRHVRYAVDHLRFVAVEGNIGVGKTSLAKLLAKKLKARLLLEEVDQNPFLSSFYQDKIGYAFQTQIFFILSRYRQQRELAQTDLFTQRIVTDYLFAKDKIFAYVNLDDNEISLYERLLPLLEKEIPVPDLVIYLQASPDFLLKRIRERASPYEEAISLDYLRELNEAYTQFFFHYTDSPLLVVSAEKLDFARTPQSLEELMKEISTPFKGTRYWLPPPGCDCVG